GRRRRVGDQRGNWTGQRPLLHGNDRSDDQTDRRSLSELRKRDSQGLLKKDEGESRASGFGDSPRGDDGEREDAPGGVRLPGSRIGPLRQEPGFGRRFRGKPAGGIQR